MKWSCFFINMAENLAQKITRHVLDGSFDSATLIRGGKQIMGTLATYKENEGRIVGPSIFSDYGYVKGLDVADYQLEIPSLLGSDFFRKFPFRIYDFPVDSSVNLTVTPTEKDYLDTINSLSLNRKAFAYFTGPTHNEKGLFPQGFPNNGFYFEGAKEQIPFRSIPPHGERPTRGAFSLDYEERISLLSDDEKQKIIDNNYQGVRALVGCSFYFTNETSWGLEAFQFNDIKEKYSYLLQYRNKEDQLKTCFMITPSVVSLHSFRRIMENYIDYVGADKYKAVEMEYNGSSAGVRTLTGRIEHFGSGSFPKRFDHYTVQPSFS